MKYKGCPRCKRKMPLEVKGQCEECKRNKYKYLKTLPSVKTADYRKERYNKTN